MGFWSGVWDGVTSVVSAVTDTVAAAWESTKKVAAKAISWMAEKAETFVGTVKSVWQKVKPFISTVVQPALKIAAKWAATNLPTFPWVAGAIVAFDKALGVLVAWDQTEMAAKVEKAINWAIDRAKQLKGTWLNDEEMAVAEQHEETLREARSNLRGDAAKAIDLASLITSYAQLTTRISNALENSNIESFEHYLRLRAAQKLLKDTERRLTEAQDIQAINADDLFLMEIGAELLKKDPQISDAQAMRLDDIILSRFKQKLIPFVFEEMIMAWGHSLQDMEQEWKTLNEALAKDKVLLRRLEVAQRLSDLEPEEAAMLKELQDKLPPLREKLETQRKRTNEMRSYVFAAEGFLQMLEKNREDYAGKEYLLDDSAKAGMIIIECAQHGRQWEELTEDEQALIIDFANIYEEASRARAAKLVEVAA
ncbi:hypothetical protein [Stutzerimonas stutzeri]|jgi:AraC-like DNA-binding protein|uniref:hypothetical protein n=1 Tax=Stutzerimonas stutzeri TaxID=316 RepID=UPI002446E193|nr:hypothetical protein [Stutzerimonas stutzeri]MDH0059384.1 hypothetical protein [Stutzerimonas stutzeri]